MAKGGRATPRARQDGEPAVFSGGAVGGVQDRGSDTVSGADADADADVGPLVLQSCARGDGVARKQLRRARKDGWTPHRRAQFLQVLAATCNVREAARATGLHFSSAYDLRQRDPDFAAAWAEAIERAYSELEMRMLRDCLYGAARVEVIREGHGPTARVKSTKTVTAVPHSIALRLLQAHRAQAEAFRAKAQAGVRATRPDDPDVVARMKAEMDAMVARYDAGRVMLAGLAGG